MQYTYPARRDTFYSFDGISDSVSDLSKNTKKKKKEKKPQGEWVRTKPGWGFAGRAAWPH